METIGKYRLHHKIAQGGMAEIFTASRVNQTDDDAGLLCVKRIRPEFSSDADFVQMFEQEARIAMALHAPAVVKVFDFDAHQGRLFLAMEYVDGWDVKRILSTVRDLGTVVPVGFAFHVFSSLMSALQAARRVSVNGREEVVVHRDISPHNILVSKTGDVKLTDFGIAKARGSSRVTRTGVIKGKLAYLSPEQAAAADVGPASDMYGAGLVLYELLTGIRFQRGHSEAELLASVIHPRQPEIPWLSREINQFLRVLLSRKPEDRFDTPDDALSAMQAMSLPEYSRADAAVFCMGVITSAVGQNTGMIHVHTPSDVSVSEKDLLEDAPTRTSKQIPQNAVRFRGPQWRFFVVTASMLVLATLVAWRVKRPVTVREDIVTANVPIRASAAEAPSALKLNTVQPGAASGPVLTLSNEDIEQPYHELSSVSDTEFQRVEPVHRDRPESVAAGGMLQVLCRPWAHVSIDGVPIGTTPIRDKRLSAGKHRVRLRNVSLDYDKTMQVIIRKGKDTRVSEIISTTDTEAP
ncbi:MAG: serine/threonine protein kinase [Deltaproteobacteria bacterium]|nr:serine/threonine protein kinase [Deltaproteobacteria bacterium]MBN2671309.1 serine/threonine protein kinase [Deltaproteobacteria bacterium]